MKLEEFAKLSTCVSHYALQTQGEFEDMNLLPLVRWAAGGRPGFSGSMTLVLEKCFGWHGVLIEGHPVTCEKLQRADRANANKVCGCVCPAGQKVHMSGLNLSKGDPTAVTAAVEFMSEEYKATWKPLLDMQHLFEVPCIPMTQIVADAELPGIDFLSIDTQGSEDIVLQTTNLSAVKVVIVEAERTAAQKNERVRKMLLGAGFVQIPHTQQPQKRHGGAQYNELFALKSLVRQRSGVKDDIILYPLRDSPISRHDKHSRVARFVDGLLAMDEMTRAVDGR